MSSGIWGNQKEPFPQMLAGRRLAPRSSYAKTQGQRQKLQVK